MASNPNNDKKQRGTIFNWLKMFFLIVPALLLVKTVTHAFVQFPEDRANAICLETYWLVEFYYVDLFVITSINDPNATIDRAEKALKWKVECNDSNAFGLTKLIPNIPKINMRDEADEW